MKEVLTLIANGLLLVVGIIYLIKGETYKALVMISLSRILNYLA